jgi:hypothetical protein
MTGAPPVFEPEQRRGKGMGQLWNDYIDRIRESEYLPFQRAFKDYLVKGYPRWRPEPADPITGYDAYWITSPIPPPGEKRAAGETKREKLFTHARGGRIQTERLPTLARPDGRRPPPPQPPPEPPTEPTPPPPPGGLQQPQSE